MTACESTPRRASIEVGGRGLSYLEWGSADAPTMVLLHGGQWPCVQALQCRTLVVRGGSSPLFGADIARRMVETNSRISVVEIPGAGHSVHHEKPAEVIAAVRHFLSA